MEKQHGLSCISLLSFIALDQEVCVSIRNFLNFTAFAFTAYVLCKNNFHKKILPYVVLFGSITSKQIAQAMEKQHGLKIDKRKMELAAPIRAMGYANVPVKLHNEVSAKIRVHISEQ